MKGLFRKSYVVSYRWINGNKSGFGTEGFTVSGYTPFNLYVDEEEARERIEKQYNYDNALTLSIFRGLNKSQSSC